MRECSSIDYSDFESYLNFISEPSAKIAAELFSKVANVIEKPDLIDTLYRLGYRFGTLVHFLDAMKDLEKDIIQSEFNPFHNFYGTAALSARDNSIDHLDFLRADVEILFAELHLDEEKAAIFAARLLANMNKISTKILWQEPLKLNFIERIGQRYLSAKAIATSKICTQNGFSGKLQYNLMHWATFLSPQSENKGVIESQSSFFVAILTLLGLTWVVSLLPVKGKNIKKSKRKFSLFKKSKKGEDEPFSNCGTMILFGILFILTLMVGMLVFGIILITKGFVFWGLFAMLILPLVL